MVAVFVLGVLPGALVGMATPADATVGVITRLAGTGTSGGAGDGGPAVSAQLHLPAGIAGGPDGSLYIADEENKRIRRVWPDGTISTFAGSGMPGVSGDGGPAVQATLGQMSGIAVDGVGNVYVAQFGANVVRRIDHQDGTIATVAGRAWSSGFSGDNGPASQAVLTDPHGLAIAPNGDLLIVDSGNRRVRRVSAVDSTITTVAGSGASGANGVGGSATSAGLGYPVGVAADAAGTFWISDSNNHRVLQVKAGTLTRVAGVGSAGFSGDGGPATSAALRTPLGLAVGGGNLFIADRDNHRVRRVDATGKITTVAGTGVAGSSGDGGAATAASLHAPAGLAVTADGDLVEAERLGHVVRSVAGLVPPLPPTLTGTSPGSPGSSTAPAVRGTAPARTTVTLHTDAACTSPAAGAGTRADLAGAGIGVVVPTGTTRTFWATSTSGGGAVSACSTTAVTYTADTTPPPAPTLTASPASPTKQPQAAWSFTAETGAGTTCSLARGAEVVRAAATCLSPVTYDLTGEDDGDYVLSVVATDAAGNTGATRTSGVLTVDRQPPAAPVHDTPASTSANTVRTWEFRTDPATTTRCELRATTGDVVQSWAACSGSVTGDLNGKPPGDYALATTSTDAAGNEGPESVSEPYSLISAQDARPVVTRTPTRADLPRPSWEFAVAASATPTCVLTGPPGTAPPADCTSPYVLTDPVADGTYSLSITSDGFTTTSTYVHDTTPAAAPVITSRPADVGRSAAVTWSFTGEGPSYACALRRPGTTPAHPADYTACASPFSRTLTGQGDWRLWVVTIDAAGNVSPPAVDDLTYDATPPATPTVSGGGVGTTPAATWTITSDPGTTTQCQLSRGATVIQASAACPASGDFTFDPVEGTYALDVTATDVAGNVSTAAGRGTYVLDRTAPDAPEIRRTAPADRIGASHAPAWDVSGEASATLTCTVQQGSRVVAGPVSCPTSYTADLTDEPDAEYALVVSARDAAGNTSEAASSTYVLDTAAGEAPITPGQRTPSPLRTLSWTFTAAPDDTAECRLIAPQSSPPAWGACPERAPARPGRPRRHLPLRGTADRPGRQRRHPDLCRPRARRDRARRSRAHRARHPRREHVAVRRGRRPPG
jgi:hypothetical protein